MTDLFDNLNNNNSTYKVKISFLEIYGEDVFDLIAGNGIGKSPRNNFSGDRISLPVREDEQGKVFVQGDNNNNNNSDDILLL